MKIVHLTERVESLFAVTKLNLVFEVFRTRSRRCGASGGRGPCPPASPPPAERGAWEATRPHRLPRGDPPGEQPAQPAEATGCTRSDLTFL
jgi:hypothetical protein